MIARDWLNHLATLIQARFPRSRTSVVSVAPALAKDVPGRFLTPDTAERVAEALPALPNYRELLAAVRREGELLPAEVGAAPHRSRLDPPPELPHEREERLEREVQAWWEARLARFASIANPTARWREVMGMAAVLNRPGAYPRPYLVGQIRDVLDQAEHEGADTDPTQVQQPPQIRTPDFRMPVGYPRSRAAAVPSAPAQPAAKARAAQAADDARERAFDRALEARAYAGDEAASKRLYHRTGKRIIEHAPEMAR